MLLRLPVELIVRILSLLDHKEVVVCSGVSRQLRDIVETSIPLQYIVELGLSGLVDSMQCHLNTVERLHRLREHEDAWSTMTWKSTSRIPVGKRYIFYELCGGMFAGSYKSGRIESPHPRAFDLLDIFDLRSNAEDGPPNTITLERLFCSFSLDIGQNLLVLVEDPPTTPDTWLVHIRSLLDGSPHPKTVRLTIEIPVAHQSWPNRLNDPGSIEIQILGNIVLCSQRRGPGLSGSVSVFDWTTGIVLCMIYPALGNWACTLLSEKELLVVQRPSFRSQPCIELYEFDPRSKWLAPRITYLLPFEGVERMWRPEACYDSSTCSNTDQSHTQTFRPFFPPREPSLLAFRFTCSVAAENAPTSVDMFLSPERLKKHGRMGDTVVWELWGPESTRWFRDVLPTKWRRNIHGHRAVLPLKNTLLDFNANFWTEGDEGVVIQSSHILLGTSSSKSIVSSLPYRALQPAQAFGFADVMLDDDIVCVERAPDDIGMVEAFRVLHF